MENQSRKDSFSMHDLINHYNMKVNFYENKRFETWHVEKELSVVSRTLDAILRNECYRSALDIACHAGRYSFMLQEKGLDVIGIDTSDKALNFAEARKRERKIHNIVFKKMDATQFSFNQTFDVVILMELLHHLPDDLAEQVLTRAIGYLNPRGVLFFDLKNSFNPVIRYVYRKESSDLLWLRARTFAFFKKIVEKAHARIVAKQGLVTPLWQIEPFVILQVKKK